MELTLQNLVEEARKQGWVATYTTNVHLDRPDWQGGTGAILVETFNEDGLPSYFLAGMEKSGSVCIGGDKLNERPFASTVEGVLEWARYTWDSPDDPMPALFLENDDTDDWGLLERLFEIALLKSRLGAEMKVRIQDWMVDEGWTERQDDGKFGLTDKGMKILEGDAP